MTQPRRSARLALAALQDNVSNDDSVECMGDDIEIDFVEEPPAEPHCGLCNAPVEISGPFLQGQPLFAVWCQFTCSVQPCCHQLWSLLRWCAHGVPHSHRLPWTSLVFSICVACTVWRSHYTIAPCAPSPRRWPILWRCLVAASACTAGVLCVLCTPVEKDARFAPEICCLS